MHVDVNKIEEIYETSQRGARKKKSNTTKIQNEWSKRKKNGGKNVDLTAECVELKSQIIFKLHMI